MKNVLLLLLGVSPIIASAQTFKNQISAEPTGRTDRISFIAGPGASYITRDVYDSPSVNQTTNAVVIEEASKIKTNLALGIIYTPYIYDITHINKYIDADGIMKYRQVIESVPKGQTIALFLNPLALTKTYESQSFSSMVEFGVGYGYRFAGGLVLLGTAEYFSARQPRQWFTDTYKGKDLPYAIGGAVQKSIDINDNSIFTNKPVLTFGFKLCYSFDILKSYISGAQDMSPGTSTGAGTGTGTGTPPPNEKPK